MASNPHQIRHVTMTENSAVHQVLPILFRRIVRLLIGTISFPIVADALRTIYVEEAKKKLLKSGSRPTNSALALITGLDTRVVSSILKENPNPNTIPVSANPENSLIDIWSSDKNFLDPSSEEPAILPIEGKGRTFQSLVLRAIGRNITVKTVLDRLLKGGTVQIVDGDIPRVELVSRFYNPISSDYAKSTEVGLLESSRVLEAVLHNINCNVENRVPQQGRWTYRLDPKNHPKFRSEVRALLERQIKEGDALLEKFEETQKQPGQLTVGIGWYQWGDHDPENIGDSYDSLDDRKIRNRD
jgi:hypothetical protein